MMVKEQTLDLPRPQISLLQALIRQHIPNKTVWAYGSRVTWRASETSDLDLVVHQCDSSAIYDLREALEESNLLVSVDVMNWETIPDSFKDNIKRKYVVIQQGLPEGWQTDSIGNLFHVSVGGDTSALKTQKHKDDKFRFPVYANNLKNNGIHCFSDTYQYDGEYITVTARGDVGVANYRNGPFCAVIRLLVLSAKENINTKFFYYLLNHQLHFDHVGSAVNQLTAPMLKSENLTFPASLETQKNIAEILSSLDDKIDFLHRQNKTLEDMAQTLFRKWFVVEADNQRKNIALGDIIEIYDNKRVPLSSIERGQMKDGFLYPYYGAAQIMDYVNDYIFDGEYILLAEDGTVKTSENYPVLQYATGKFWVNNHTHVIKAKEPYKNIFIWHLLLKLDIGHIVSGAVQPKINQTNLKSVEVLNHSLSKVKKFQELSQCFLDRIIANKSQIDTLKKWRDILLPKLMSGKISLK